MLPRLSTSRSAPVKGTPGGYRQRRIDQIATGHGSDAALSMRRKLTRNRRSQLQSPCMTVLPNRLVLKSSFGAEPTEGRSTAGGPSRSVGAAAARRMSVLINGYQSRQHLLRRPAGNYAFPWPFRPGRPPPEAARRRIGVRLSEGGVFRVRSQAELKEWTLIHPIPHVFGQPGFE